MLYLLILSSMVVKCFVFVNICTTYKYSNYAAAPYQHFIRYKSRIQIHFLRASFTYSYTIAAYIQILDIAQFSEIYSTIYIHLVKRCLLKIQSFFDKRKILSSRFDFNSANSWNTYLLPYRSFIIQKNMIT